MTPARQPVIVGLTGRNASGKGEAAAHLETLGYALHSLSDIVREEATRLRRDHSRASLIRTGREMRAAGGPPVLAERILPRLVPPCVVDSIRNPGEVEALRRHPRFRLLGIEAPLETRFRRTIERARPGDPLTLPEFVEKEKIEDSDDPEGQRLGATFGLADAVVRNDGTIGDLCRRVEEVIRRWEEEP